MDQTQFEFVKQGLRELDAMTGTTPQQAYFRYVVQATYRSEGLEQAEIDRLEANSQGLFSHLN